MEQLEAVVTVALILGAAFVAYICDLLKRNNEELREQVIALKARREETQKRWRVLTPEPSVPKENGEKKRPVSAAAFAAMDRGAMLASRSATVPEVKESKPAPKPQEVAAKTPVKNDWGSLLNRNALRIQATPKPLNTPSRIDLRPTVVPATPAGHPLPEGFQDGDVLRKLVESRQTVSGLVVSIGVNAASGNLGAVRSLVESLIGPGDFAAQSREDEFVLIYPNQQGASAQRMLTHIAEQLWSFQLRSRGPAQGLFSWGGLEVRGESIEEAIASANERMRETPRVRKLITMSASAGATGLRQAM